MSVRPPRPRGPHLNAMRCFEAAARLGGFSAAAEELSVTSGAISQQIKALEDWIGAPLFERRSQGVSLTPLGASVRGSFTDAFDALGLALHDLRNAGPAGRLNIAALPAVAQLWVSPRLAMIRHAFASQDISITAVEQPPNLIREVFDLSIFFGTPSGSATQRILAEDILYPVCSAQIAARLKTVDDLAGHALIQDASWSEDWARWLAHAGAAHVAISGPSFSLYSIALDEARNGAGVLMGHAPLVDRYVKSGELVRPFPQGLKTGKSLIAEVPHAASLQGDVGKILDVLTADG